MVSWLARKTDPGVKRAHDVDTVRRLIDNELVVVLGLFAVRRRRSSARPTNKWGLDELGFRVVRPSVRAFVCACLDRGIRRPACRRLLVLLL